jgi:hypothetical protein
MYMYVIEVRCTRIGNEHMSPLSHTSEVLLLRNVESLEYHTAGENATVNSKTIYSFLL